MRFVVDVTPLVTPPRRGVARSLAHLLDGLVARGDAPDVVLAGPKPFPSGVGLSAAWREAASAPATETPRAFRRRAAPIVRAAGANAWFSPFSAFPRVDVAVVATVHEVPFVRAGPVEGRLRSWRHRAWLARNAAECAAIVVPSRATRDDVVTLHPDAAPRVHVVPNGFDPSPWEAAAEGAVRRDRHGILVGATHARKGIGTFLEALPRLDDLGLTWTIVGRPEGSFARRLARFPGVEIPDDLDDGPLARAVAAASFLVFPSASEGFGYPPLEAMAAGVPVVATDAGSVPEVVGDAAVSVRAGDAGALADGIRRVATDAALRRDLAARGRRRCLAFPPEAAARRVVEVVRLAAGVPT